MRFLNKDLVFFLLLSLLSLPLLAFPFSSPLHSSVKKISNIFSGASGTQLVLDKIKPMEAKTEQKEPTHELIKYVLETIKENPGYQGVGITEIDVKNKIIVWEEGVAYYDKQKNLTNLIKIFLNRQTKKENVFAGLVEVKYFCSEEKEASRCILLMSMRTLIFDIKWNEKFVFRLVTEKGKTYTQILFPVPETQNQSSRKDKAAIFQWSLLLLAAFLFWCFFR